MPDPSPPLTVWRLALGVCLGLVLFALASGIVWGFASVDWKGDDLPQPEPYVEPYVVPAE